MSGVRFETKQVLDRSDERFCDVLDFPQQLIPMAAGMLYRRFLPAAWKDEYYADGKNMIATGIEAMYRGSAGPTAEAVDRVYRLLDGAYFGTTYTIAPSGEAEPQIPVVPDLAGFDGSGTLAIASAHKSEDYANFQTANSLLEEIRDKLGVASSEDLVPLLQAIIAAL